MEVGTQNIKKKVLILFSFVLMSKKRFLNFTGSTAMLFGFFTKNTLVFTD